MKSKKDKISKEEKFDEAEILSTSFQSVNTTDQPYTWKNSKLKVNYSWFLSSKKIILEFKTNKQDTVVYAKKRFLIIYYYIENQLLIFNAVWTIDLMLICIKIF